MLKGRFALLIIGLAMPSAMFVSARAEARLDGLLAPQDAMMPEGTELEPVLDDQLMLEPLPKPSLHCKRAGREGSNARLGTRRRSTDRCLVSYSPPRYAALRR